VNTQVIASQKDAGKKPTSQQSQQQQLEQKRAKAAWDDVQGAKAKGYAKEYRQLARGAAADIQINGLGQTLSFWMSKIKKSEPPAAHSAIYQNVSAWVTTQVGSGASDLMAWIIAPATTTDDYRRATAEAMAFLSWLKRFAEAEIADDKTKPEAS
jgi:CRISPR-associated protein Cmr5